MASGDAYDVFISTACSDGDAAAELIAQLVAQGALVCDRSVARGGGGG